MLLLSLLQRTVHSLCHLERMCWPPSPPSPLEPFLRAPWGGMVGTSLVCWCGFWGLPPATKGRSWDAFFGTQKRSEHSGHISIASWEDACPVWSWSSTPKGCLWWSLHWEPTEEAGNWLNLLKSLMRGSLHREAISLDQSLLA